MTFRYILTAILAVMLHLHLSAQRKSDAHIIGHVTAEGEHLPFASVSVKGTTLGALADETGHFQILHVQPGTYTVVASMVGYAPRATEVAVKAGVTSEIKFELEKDVLNINQVVVTSDRSEQKRTEAPVIVSTLPSKLFEATLSVSLGEGLVFTPGIRLENNCQNCGFSQVRLNGMEGPYSQVLINSRPIFSGLAGVYGLELIPANMIDRVEVVRGGGSALYGSNAIAGTINVILKDPVINSFEAGAHYALTGTGTSGTAAGDYVVNLNSSMVSSNSRTGLTIYGYYREREMYDANNDGFSELSPLDNLTLGSRFYHRIGSRAKLSLDLFSIAEDRDGGNMQEYPLHERDVAEAVEHHIKTAAVNYEQFFRDYDLLSLYFSTQHLARDSYYGAEQSLSDYGYSTDLTWNAGAQYKAFFGHSTLVSGVEQTSGTLRDEKLGYPDYERAVMVDGELQIPHVPNTLVAHQRLTTTGLFSQYELTFMQAKINLGARVDQYQVSNLVSDADPKSGLVFSPRISLMYDLLRDLQLRASYAQGYRAPQIFDEDLHIETSGARQVIHVNDPDLIQENSHSVTASFDLNTSLRRAYVGLLAEGFYTRLTNPFVNDIGVPDENGQVVYTRMNAESGATVQGVNLELKLNFGGPLMLNSGFTLQRSLYDEPQEFDTRRFFRTPDRYGYVQVDYSLSDRAGLNLNGVYTGPMQVPYFGVHAADMAEGELRTSEDFFDLGLRAWVVQQADGLKLQWFAGVKNLFNAYQSDFDTGMDRDPAYMYGPMNPRTVYVGVKISNAAIDLDRIGRGQSGYGRGLGPGKGRGLNQGRGLRRR